MLATLLLLGFMAVVVYTDLSVGKIFNATTYPGILIALGGNALGEALVGGGYVSAEQFESWGGISLGQSLGGFFLCGFLMLVCFVFFRIGGGDVKLMAMLGSFLGMQQGLESLLWTFVLGGCVGVIILIWRNGAWRLLRRMVHQAIWSLRIFRWSPLSDEERRQLQTRLYLAPCALAAVVIVRFNLLTLVFP